MSTVDPQIIPWKELIIPQATNFVLFVGLLTFLVKKPIGKYFSDKREEFEDLRKKAEEAKVAAERKNHEIKSQLKVLEDGAHESLERAKSDAAEQKKRLIQEAEQSATKMIKDAEKTTEFEYARAITLLRQELVETAASMAAVELKTKADAPTKMKLANDFINKIQAAKL